MTSRQDVQKRRVWETRLERFRTGGLTVAAFCAQEGVSTNTFYYWSRRVGVATSSVTPSTSRRGGTFGRGRQPQQPRPAASGNEQAGLVRFHWNAGVEVSVPADCLDAIRCLAQCLPQAQVERTDGFQELVVHS
jgi:hypothetical protein